MHRGSDIAPSEAGNLQPDLPDWAIHGTDSKSACHYMIYVLVHMSAHSLMVHHAKSVLTPRQGADILELTLDTITNIL